MIREGALSVGSGSVSRCFQKGAASVVAEKLNRRELCNKGTALAGPQAAQNEPGFIEHCIKNVLMRAP
jgi:hypothetical protein